MKKDKGPLYLQLADELRQKIKDGEFAAGSVLPPERTLCEQYRVSRTTVRQAINSLAQQGFTKSVQGKGTVVLQPQIDQALSAIYSFDQDMRRLGRHPETRILDFITMTPTGNLAAHFQLETGGAVYRIMRLRLADGEPMLLETNYLPCRRFQGLGRQDLEDHSLYQLLENRYGLSITIAEESFEPVQLRAIEAQVFGSAPGTLGMLVERISYEHDQVVEISKSVSPSYRFKHHVVLSR